MASISTHLRPCPCCSLQRHGTIHHSRRQPTPHAAVCQPFYAASGRRDEAVKLQKLYFRLFENFIGMPTAATAAATATLGSLGHRLGSLADKALNHGGPASLCGAEAKINQSAMCDSVIQPSIYSCSMVNDVQMPSPDMCLHKIQHVVLTGTHSARGCGHPVFA